MLWQFIRLIFLFSALYLLIGGERAHLRNDSQEISIRPLMLDPERPDLRRVGALDFLGAWELGSDNQDFGGLSGLATLPDGRFIAVSDAGTLVGFGLTGDNRIDRPFIAPMPDAFARDRNFTDRDSEAILHDADSGKFWVAYEGKHAIRRFGRAFARREAIARPKAMQKWSENSGAEAIVRLADGRFVVFSEGHDTADGGYEALVFAGDPTEDDTAYFAFSYLPPAGYKITDAAQLPDGRILTLNRRLGFPEGFSSKLAIFDSALIKRNAAIAPKVIATLAAPLLVDNFEGLTVAQQADGQIILWMISDNNFNIWQRTILIKLAFTPPKQGTKKPAARKAPGFDAI